MKPVHKLTIEGDHVAQWGIDRGLPRPTLHSSQQGSWICHTDKNGTMERHQYSPHRRVKGLTFMGEGWRGFSRQPVRTNPQPPALATRTRSTTAPLESLQRTLRNTQRSQRLARPAMMIQHRPAQQGPSNQRGSSLVAQIQSN